MKLKPILFSTEMVQAIMAGRKTQTRRPQGLEEINEEPDRWGYTGNFMHVSCPGNLLYANFQSGKKEAFIKLRFQPGDVLWVRETSCYVQLDHAPDLLEGSKDRIQTVYKASVHEDWMKYAREKYGYFWKPSIFMPKAAARNFLRITRVIAERMQDISEVDAVAEGVESS